MKINKIHYSGIFIGILLIIISLSLMQFNIINMDYVVFISGIGILIIAAPFVVSIINSSKIESEKEDMFLEFARNLVESVKTGTPVSKSIINNSNKSYGVLTEHVKKLANQISIGIPLGIALQIFSKDVNNKKISRSLTLIGQAEKAGGEIGEILESVAGAVSMADKLKKERKAAISTLVVQGYVIFLVFTIIILIMQFKIVPMIGGIADTGVDGGFKNPTQISTSDSSGSDSGNLSQEIASSFLYLLLVQGFFSGLVIGELSDGNLKYGLKHSFALMLISFLISTGARVIIGS